MQLEQLEFNFAVDLKLIVMKLVQAFPGSHMGAILKWFPASAAGHGDHFK
jgi:hypothetical protein